jgi:tripartite-type tricarboxylate transporter receptor subunit TctC
VHPSLPVNSVKELIAYAKARPGQLQYSSSGNAGPPHMAMEMLKLLAQIDMMHIPYKGTGPGMTDLLAGRVSLTFASIISVRSHVESGKLRLLAIASSKRSPVLPKTPTVAEAGVPGYSVDVWYGMFAPSATPRAIIAKLNGELIKMMQVPSIGEKMMSLGLEPLSAPLAETNAYVKSEIEKWAKVVKAANITAN